MEDDRDKGQGPTLRVVAGGATRAPGARALRRGARNAVPFRRWLVRVAVNLAKNHVRDEGRHARVSIAEARDAGETGAGEHPGPSAAETLLHAERSARLRVEVLR